MTTVSASVLTALFQAAVHHGLDDRELAKAAGIQRAVLEDVDARVPVSALAATWRELARRVDDPLLGLHVAERFIDSRTYTVVGLAARRCTTVGEALGFVVRYSHVVNEGSDTRLVPGDGVVVLIDQPKRPPPWPRHHAEAALGAIVSLGRRWVGDAARPVRVAFQHAAPADPGAVEKWFGAPVAFRQRHNALELSASAMDIRLPEPDAELREYLEAKARAVMSSLAPEGLGERVRTAVRAELADGAALEAVAKRVGLTGRTLQRRLAEEGFGYQNLVEEERCAAGLFALQHAGTSVMEAARRAGYADPKAFRRACKRWLGLSPRDLRRRA